MTADSDSPIRVVGGRPWFSWAVLAGVAVLAVSGAGVYFTVTSGQADVARRLATNEQTVSRATETLQVMAGDIRDTNSALHDINISLAEVLRDRWTSTDQAFLNQSQQLFWAEYRRLNPSIQVPPWPEAKRVVPDSTLNDSGGR